MKEMAFNLVDEPWIRVMTPDCRVSEVSLLDALVNAHIYKSIAGEMEAQNVAVLRLLIAVAHTVFTRVNLDGEQDPVEDEKTAMDRWATLMRNGKLPPDPIQDYLKTWHERFWLFHPERPFYQVPSACIGTKYDACKLNGAVSESGNNARLFSSVAGVEKRSMSFSESARWLLFINGFDDCAAKPKGKDLPSIKVAWLGHLGLVTVAGDSLFESILLNMTMLINGEEIWQKDDKPIWELGEVREKEREIISMPQDFAGLLTLQSRRLLLIREEDRVTGYHVLGGDAFDETSDKSEPMTLWKKSEINKKLIFKPCQHDRARQIWRDFGAFVKVGENERRPGVVAWCSLLQNQRIVPRHRYITFRICSTRYKPPLLSCITDSFSDVLSFHVNLLTDAGKVWIRQIEEQLNKIEEAAMQVGNLEVNLGKALGLYYLCDACFLVGLESEDTVLLNRLAEALQSPCFPLYLGRRSCPPTLPLCLGIRQKPLAEALEQEPWQASDWYQGRQRGSVRLRLILETPKGQPAWHSLRDQPVTFSPIHRQYTYRGVEREQYVCLREEQGQYVIFGDSGHDPMAEL